VKKNTTVIIIFILAALTLMPGTSDAKWVFQLGSGSAYNFTTPLDIRQDGEADINLSARYDTRAFSTFAWYFDMRIARWKNNHAWEFETLHHKLHLDNRPDEVQRFDISHGYNLYTLNSAWLINNFIYRLGLGVVITHPETIVRNKEYNDKGGVNGFHLSGVTAQAAMEKRFSVTEKIFVYLEAKLTASYATIPVGDGDASVPNAAIHGLFGTGYSF
jgi:hypothetical protein